MEDKTIYVLDTNIHLDCITTALLSKINFYSMVNDTGCLLGIAPVTKDEILRNLPKSSEERLQKYRKDLDTANKCLNNVKEHVDKLGTKAEKIVKDCISIIQNYKQLQIEYEEAKQFCHDSIFNAPYSVVLVESEAIDNVIHLAEERVKYHKLPASNKQYDLGDCIYWETVKIAAVKYSDIVFSTRDSAFIHKDDLHPYLKDELPNEKSFHLYKDSKDLIKHVRNKLPDGETKYPDDLISSSSSSTSVSSSLTSIPSHLFDAPTAYFYKQYTCPSCGHIFTPDSYVTSSRSSAFIVCPNCGNSFNVFE